MKKGIQLFVCSLIVLLYCFALEAPSYSSITPFQTETTTSLDNRSQLSSDLHGLSSFLQPNESQIQLTPTQVKTTLKSVTKVFGGLPTIVVTPTECAFKDYAAFLRHFPIPFRALEQLYPSHYFW